MRASLAPLLAVFCWVGAAVGAQPRVEIEAVVFPRLDAITGTLCWEGERPADFVDVLGTLPEPPDDRTALRTWPGGPSEGWVRWQEGEGSCIDFEASVPDRYGAVGRVPGSGLFLNGGWYPQPVDVEGHLPELSWSVSVRLPLDMVGAVGSTAGEGLLRWDGRGERVGLAVVPGGRVERLETTVGSVALVSRRGFTGARKRWLTRSLEAAWPAQVPLDLVLADAPLMRRLVRPGPGLLFLSSRAFRVSPGLKHLHRLSVTRGLLEAGLHGRLPAQNERALVAAALADQALVEAPTARGLLRWVSWLPQIDELLYSGSVPYVADVMGEPWPGDTLQDDLLELLDPRLPGAVVAARMRARGAEPVSLALGLLDASSAAPALPPVRYAAADQDYRLEVGPEGIRVVRDAPAVAPPEPVVLSVDGERMLLEFEGGPGAQAVQPAEPPDRVAIDPDGLLRQADRANDRWPTRWTTVVSAFPTVWNLSSGRLEGYLALRFRRQHDTRWYYDTFLFRDEVDEVGFQGSVGRSWGPLQDRRWRPFRLRVWASAALLDPDFRPTDRGKVAVDLGATWVWDTQVDWIFPLRGHQLLLAANGGFVPSGDQRWASVGAMLGGVHAPHPRVAFAGQLRGGSSWGEVEHRLEVLGGVHNLRSIPVDLAVGDTRAVARGELRVAPLRHVSVPLGFAWLDEVQLAGGLEGGVLRGATVEESYGPTPTDGIAAAVGWTASSFVVLDVLGGQPALAGLLLAGPLVTEPEWIGEQAPSLYLMWEQAF